MTDELELTPSAMVPGTLIKEKTILIGLFPNKHQLLTVSAGGKYILPQAQLVRGTLVDQVRAIATGAPIGLRRRNVSGIRIARAPGRVLFRCNLPAGHNGNFSMSDCGDALADQLNDPNFKRAMLTLMPEWANCTA